MKTTSRTQDALPTTITLRQLAEAMKQLDLSAVPPHKRKAAIDDHLARIMSERLLSPTARQAMALARDMRQRHTQ